ncbi:hypothetical protein [Shewanella algae]|uniref:hypothetical protein n=1 Tax=Shewanella algae TaxID=38313 RepID=UPI003004536E
MKIINPLYLVPIALLIVLGPFVFTFWGTSFSTSMQDWAHFGTYFAGMLTPVAGLAIFWQMYEKRKSDDSDKKLRKIEKTKDLIERHISLYDELVETRYRGKIVKLIPLRQIQKGLVEKSIIPSNIPNKSYIMNKKDDLIYFHLMLISGNLDDLSFHLKELQDHTLIRGIFFEYQILAGALAQNGWLDNSFNLYSGDIWNMKGKRGSKMAAEADKGTQS